MRIGAVYFGASYKVSDDNAATNMSLDSQSASKRRIVENEGSTDDALSCPPFS